VNRAGRFLQIPRATTSRAKAQPSFASKRSVSVAASAVSSQFFVSVRPSSLEFCRGGCASSGADIGLIWRPHGRSRKSIVDGKGKSPDQKAWLHPLIALPDEHSVMLRFFAGSGFSFVKFHHRCCRLLLRRSLPSGVWIRTPDSSVVEKIECATDEYGRLTAQPSKRRLPKSSLIKFYKKVKGLRNEFRPMDFPRSRAFEIWPES
jgi:hypothetical protein